jgi:hypothetical protein
VIVHAIDEYCRLGENNCNENYETIMQCHQWLPSTKQLWKPIRVNISNNLKIDKDRVSLACLQAFIVCIRNEFMDCPIAWEGQFQDEDSNMSIILKDFFGLMGNNNDINLLNKFPWLQSC